ncbi:NAD(P)H-binding protein [Nonomuraea sp. NPDC050790]|uniref:NAD(P)H-binding protein n=1 Tax=Nonomuraea sp. NPDC050790 TaxID=3364371 RepID=UPI0037BE1F4F
MNEILVLGATGSTGRRVTDRLRSAGHQVRPASRRGEVRFDWNDRDTWRPALTGAERLYLMAPDDVPVDPEFVAAAVEAGIRRIVLLSSGGIEVMGDERLMAAERVVRGSGAEWTILRPSWFDQNFDEGVMREAVLAGEVALPLGEARQAFVDAGDVAAVAAAALVEDGHEGRSYEVSGPRALSFGEAVEIIGRASGRTVRYLGSEADYLAVMTGFGMPEAEVRAQIAAFAALRDQGDAEPTGVVRQVTGRPPKSFEEFAKDARWG